MLRFLFSLGAEYNSQSFRKRMLPRKKRMLPGRINFALCFGKVHFQLAPDKRLLGKPIHLCTRFFSSKKGQQPGIKTNQIAGLSAKPLIPADLNTASLRSPTLFLPSTTLNVINSFNFSFCSQFETLPHYEDSFIVGRLCAASSRDGKIK